MNAEQYARVFRVMAAECDAIAAEERAERRDWLDQTASALGRRRHCAIVRRRVAAGLEGAAILGRRFLLSPEAHDEEIAGMATAARRTPKPESTKERIERRLGLVRSA